ncbi:hypothetical protein GCM10027185_34790 [Spirosoma pulveris]
MGCKVGGWRGIYPTPIPSLKTGEGLKAGRWGSTLRKWCQFLKTDKLGYSKPNGYAIRLTKFEE